MNYEYISVMGTMGVGKTTAARVLAKKFGSELFLEEFEGNPYLEPFYKNPRQWAFRSQSYFLEKSIKQAQEIGDARKRRSVVQDKYIEQDVHSYARAQVLLGNMSEYEWSQYVSRYEEAKQLIQSPSLIVLLKAKIPVIAQRIIGRSRGFETVDEGYLQLLDRLNFEWLKENQQCPVLIIPTDDINLVTSSHDQEIFANTVKQALPQSDIIYKHE